MTFPRAIDGDYIVGEYFVGSGWSNYYGFLYNFMTKVWIELDDIPDVTETQTAVYGIDGDNIAGFYNEPGRLYRGFINNRVNKKWDLFDAPYGETFPHHIDGDYVTGYYGNPGSYHGFLYNFVTKVWITLDIPGASTTWPCGIDMSAGTSGMITGSGVGLPGAWLYDIGNESWIPFHGPAGSPAEFLAFPYGIEGDNIVGIYNDGSGLGFLYDGMDFTTFKVEGSITTSPWDINGGNIVGFYNDGNPGRGFLYIVTLEATIYIKPDTLNLNSQDKWITCYIELPEGYNVMDIDGSTVMLEGIPAYIGKEGWARAGANTSNILDHDEDGILERMVKFDMTEVQDYLIGLDVLGDVELIITGELINGHPFEGADTIRVINKGSKQ